MDAQQQIGPNSFGLDSEWSFLLVKKTFTRSKLPGNRRQ